MIFKTSSARYSLVLENSDSQCLCFSNFICHICNIILAVRLWSLNIWNFTRINLGLGLVLLYLIEYHVGFLKWHAGPYSTLDDLLLLGHGFFIFLVSLFTLPGPSFTLPNIFAVVTNLHSIKHFMFTIQQYAYIHNVFTHLHQHSLQVNVQ